MQKLKRLIAPLSTVGLAVGLLAGAANPAASAETAAGPMQNYVVLYTANGVSDASLKSVAAAGGTVVQSYPEIGVAIVKSDRAGFGPALKARDSSVQGAASTTALGVAAGEGAAEDADAQAPVAPGTPAPGGDSLSGLQWDMDQIQAPAARALNGGSTSVVVGDIDTGLDYTHPDLAANVDFGKSVSCVGGVPNQSPSAWMDDHGHGTHTAGTIAAAKNGIGMVGVAPNVKIAGIKASTADGFFYPEAIVCSFMWAAAKGIQVTNNSYFADPYLFNCKNDPEQRAIWEAERRAIRFAQQSGTTVVAAQGNFSDDLAHPTRDVMSPDNAAPVSREITNACAVVPVEVSGVIGVTANGNKGFKSYYSSYGVGSADVVAPGGDRRLQVTPAAVNGRVLSTWPSSKPCSAALKVVEAGAVYCYLQGTSMASPHVAGIAALVVSSGVTTPGAVAARISGTADGMACPDTAMYAPFPSQSNGAPQVCQGGTGGNGFYGKGQVNALRAIGG